MRMKEETLHIWIGAFVFLLGAVFMIYSYASDAQPSANGGGDGFYLSAQFSAVDGVGVGSPVLLAGIPVGKVVRQELDPETHSAILTFSIDEELELPIDSVAEVTSDGVFGGKYIRIEPGADIELLENGDPFEFVQDSVILEELLEKIITRAEERRADKNNG